MSSAGSFDKSEFIDFWSSFSSMTASFNKKKQFHDQIQLFEKLTGLFSLASSTRNWSILFGMRLIISQIFLLVTSQVTSDLEEIKIWNDKLVQSTLQSFSQTTFNFSEILNENTKHAHHHSSQLILQPSRALRRRVNECLPTCCVTQPLVDTVGTWTWVAPRAIFRSTQPSPNSPLTPQKRGKVRKIGEIWAKIPTKSSFWANFPTVLTLTNGTRSQQKPCASTCPVQGFLLRAVSKSLLIRFDPDGRKYRRVSESPREWNGNEKAKRRWKATWPARENIWENRLTAWLTNAKAIGKRWRTEF